MAFLDSTIYFVITISILVFIHEFGHFIAARISKMRTEVFAIGFGRRLIGWNRVNGFSFGNLPEGFDQQGHTDYRISLLPLGGYVKISGMIDESFDKSFLSEEAKPWEFRSKPTYQKLFVISAGVMMNLTLALAIFAGINFFKGKQVFTTTQIGIVSEESLAAKAGFQSGDQILSVAGQPVTDWTNMINELLLENMGTQKIVEIERNGSVMELQIDGKILSEASQQSGFLPIGHTNAIIVESFQDTPAANAGIEANDIVLSIDNKLISSSQEAIDIISSNVNRELNLVILRGEDTVRTAVTPGDDGKIGIRIGDAYSGPIDYKTFGLFKSISLGIDDIITYTNLTYSSIGSVIKGDIEFGTAFGGPVRIAQFAARSADLGIISFLRFLAVLSLTLALLNILPFPVLDGGHLVIISIEGLIKRELPVKFKIAIQNFGFVILLLFMVFILYNDIINL